MVEEIYEEVIGGSVHRVTGEIINDERKIQTKEKTCGLGLHLKQLWEKKEKWSYAE